MTPFVKNTLSATLDQFASISKVEGMADFKESLLKVFESDLDFLSKTAQLDETFDDYPKLESLREIIFDLLLVNFFSSDVEKLEEDYLDSEEWESIEEQTIDKGTELLNVLLYLRECKADKIEPSLSDFLKEFLLIEDDEFQDEVLIYEAVIANQDLVDAEVEQIGTVAKALPDDDEFKELFYPVMAFFNEMNPTEAQLKAFTENSENPEFDAAVYALLVEFNKAK